MKRHILFLSSILLLASCTRSNANLPFRCYYGKEIPVSFSLPFEDVKDKKIQNNMKNAEDFSPLYFNFYLIEDDDEALSFLNMKSLSYSTEDKNRLGFSKNDNRKLVLFFQIPKGYSLKRMDNLQERENGKEIFITPSFYYYQNRTEISYYFLDLVQDESQKQDHVDSVLLFIRNSTISNLKSSDIRAILKEAES